MNINKINWLTYSSLVALAIGLFTSITFSALHHIFLLIPVFYYLKDFNFKTIPWSARALIGLIAVIILSVFYNHEIMIEGYSPLTRVKYYLFGLLGIIPFRTYFKSLTDDERTKKISHLLYILIAVTTLAGLSGSGAVWFGYNILKLKAGYVPRNGGLAGMLMNYAHNLAFFQVFLTGLVIYREQIKKYLNLNFIYSTWIINWVALFLTYTRGAWLAVVIALPFFFIRKNIKTFLFGALVLIILGAGAYKIAGTSVTRPGSDRERLSQWKASWIGFKERPILGQGFMNFEKQCTRIKLQYGVEENTFCGHAHNNYLEMLASTGILGGFFFVLWNILWFVEQFKSTSLIAKISLPLIVVFVVGGLTQATFTLGANLFLIMPLYTLSCLEQNKAR